MTPPLGEWDDPTIANAAPADPAARSAVEDAISRA